MLLVKATGFNRPGGGHNRFAGTVLLSDSSITTTATATATVLLYNRAYLLIVY